MWLKIYNLSLGLKSLYYISWEEKGREEKVFSKLKKAKKFFKCLSRMQCLYVPDALNTRMYTLNKPPPQAGIDRSPLSFSLYFSLELLRREMYSPLCVSLTIPYRPPPCTVTLRKWAPGVFCQRWQN
jgi:hypothetical protein